MAEDAEATVDLTTPPKRAAADKEEEGTYAEDSRTPRQKRLREADTPPRGDDAPRAPSPAPLGSGAHGHAHGHGHGGGGPSDVDTADLERAAAQLLRLRGYKVLPPEAAPLHAAVAEAGGGALGRRRLLLHAAGAALGGLARWAGGHVGILAAGLATEATKEALGLELRAALLPVLAHVFLALCEVDDLPAAKSLLAGAASRLLPAGMISGGIASARLLQRLRLVQSWPSADREVVAALERFRAGERCVVAVSPLGRRLLAVHLLAPEAVELSETFHSAVRLVVASSSEAAASTGAWGGLPESLDTELRAINGEAVHCVVDVSSPPVAYGAAWQPLEDSRCRVPCYSAAAMANQRGLPLPAPGSPLAYSPRRPLRSRLPCEIL